MYQPSSSSSIKPPPLNVVLRNSWTRLLPTPNLKASLRSSPSKVTAPQNVLTVMRYSQDDTVVGIVPGIYDNSMTRSMPSPSMTASVACVTKSSKDKMPGANMNGKSISYSMLGPTLANKLFQQVQQRRMYVAVNVIALQQARHMPILLLQRNHASRFRPRHILHIRFLKHAGNSWIPKNMTSSAKPFGSAGKPSTTG